MCFRHLRIALFTSALLLAASGCSEKSMPPSTEDLEITVISGGGQTATPGTALPAPVVVEVRHLLPEPLDSEPAAGIEVVWTPGAGGMVSPARSMTDALGRTSTQWTLGAAEGAQALAIRDSEGLAPAITADATALRPGSCPATGGEAHSGLISTTETWGPGLHRVTDSITVDEELIIQAGAVICVAAGKRIEFRNSGRITAIGTALNPIVFTTPDSVAGWQGLIFVSTHSGPSFLNDVRIEFSDVGIDCESNVHAIQIDHTLVRKSRRSALKLQASGSEVTRSTIDGTTEGTEAVTLLVQNDGGSILFEATVRNAHDTGIRIGGRTGSSVTLSSTEIAHSGGHGIIVGATPGPVALTVMNSNFIDNAGVGISNPNATTAIARGNWWGDPGGPSAPLGDGVSGNVDTSFSLAAPVIFTNRP